MARPSSTTSYQTFNTERREQGARRTRARDPRQVAQVPSQAGSPVARQLLARHFLDPHHRRGREVEAVSIVDGQHDQLQTLRTEPCKLRREVDACGDDRRSEWRIDVQLRPVMRVQSFDLEPEPSSSALLSASRMISAVVSSAPAKSRSVEKRRRACPELADGGAALEHGAELEDACLVKQVKRVILCDVDERWTAAVGAALVVASEVPSVITRLRWRERRGDCRLRRSGRRSDRDDHGGRGSTDLFLVACGRGHRVPSRCDHRDRADTRRCPPRSLLPLKLPSTTSVSMCETASVSQSPTLGESR